MRAAVVVVALLAACETTPSITTSLNGGVSCGTMQCATGEVCVDQVAGIDAAGDGGYRYCFLVPHGCQVFDCTGVRCAPCLQDLCSLQPVEVGGRYVDCPGQ